jgi:hypothetical protein
MPSNILTRLIKNYTSEGKRNQGRPLKRLLDVCETGTGQQVAQLLGSYMMMMMMTMMIMAIITWYINKTLSHVLNKENVHIFKRLEQAQRNFNQLLFGARDLSRVATCSARTGSCVAIRRPDIRVKHCAYGHSFATLLNPRGVTTVSLKHSVTVVRHAVVINVPSDVQSCLLGCTAV